MEVGIDPSESCGLVRMRPPLHRLINQPCVPRIEDRGYAPFVVVPGGCLMPPRKAFVNPTLLSREHPQFLQIVVFCTGHVRLFISNGADCEGVQMLFKHYAWSRCTFYAWRENLILQPSPRVFESSNDNVFVCQRGCR